MILKLKSALLIYNMYKIENKEKLRISSVNIIGPKNYTKKKEPLSLSNENTLYHTIQFTGNKESLNNRARKLKYYTNLIVFKNKNPLQTIHPIKVTSLSVNSYTNKSNILPLTLESMTSRSIIKYNQCQRLQDCLKELKELRNKVIQLKSKKVFNMQKMKQRLAIRNNYQSLENNTETNSHKKITKPITHIRLIRIRWHTLLRTIAGNNESERNSEPKAKTQMDTDDFIHRFPSDY